MTRFLGLWSLFSYLAATAAFTPPTRGTSHRQSTTTALAETPKKVVYVENPQVDAGGVAKAFVSNELLCLLRSDPVHGTRRSMFYSHH